MKCPTCFSPMDEGTTFCSNCGEMILATVLEDKADLTDAKTSETFVQDANGSQDSMTAQQILKDMDEVTASSKKTQLAEKTPPVPPAYKALTTAGIFFYFLFACLPIIGSLFLILFAFASRNKNRRSLSRAILIWKLIFILLLSVLFIIGFFFNREALIRIFDIAYWQHVIQYAADLF